ncbi:MAG: hypothetical protein NZ805_13745 [Armatimonadetes bacterium]|nr:hypothetical protein [Armatimonadota bacterium]MDW8027195.1 hypothetical protein [Armatimonadota bacterium]
MKRLWDVAKELVAVVVIARVAVEEVGGQSNAFEQVVNAVKEFKEEAIRQGHYNSSWWLDFIYSELVLAWVLRLVKKIGG